VHPDRDQRVSAPGAGPGVGDGGQIGEQVRRFSFLERAGLDTDHRRHARRRLLHLPTT
jgi:hypothetical protein